MVRFATSFLAVLFLPSISNAQQADWKAPGAQATLELWPKGAPGGAAASAAEADMTTAKDHVVAGKAVVRLGNVSRPTITVYKAEKNNTGAAVGVFLGGGDKSLGVDFGGPGGWGLLGLTGGAGVLLKDSGAGKGALAESGGGLGGGR